MADNAPFCNVSIPSPPGAPHKREKLILQPLPPGPPGPLTINIINNNFIKIENFINERSSGNFTEVSRSSATVRVTDPNDSDTFVEFNQINKLTMRDPQGDLWTWRRG